LTEVTQTSGEAASQQIIWLGPACPSWELSSSNFIAMAISLFTAIAASLLAPVHAAGTKSYNGLAITPAMGWDNWNAFGCKINEELLLSTAEKIVEFGLRDLGMCLPMFGDCTMLTEALGQGTTTSF